MFDFNTAETQREPIPADTVAVIQMNIKPGDAGEGKWLKKSNDSKSEGLDCEFTLVDGKYAKRKFRERFTVSGETDGQKQAGDISRRTLRAILESACGIKPDDMSESAMAARQVAGWGDFDGLRFIGRIGAEPAKNGHRAKNTLLEVITPEHNNWHRVEQVVKSAEHPVERAGSEPAQPIARPDWAK
jgi:hypothetical protein